MQNNFLEKYRYLIFCTFSGFIAFSTSVSYLITDSNFLFHEGEYVGLLWHMRSYYLGATDFPLLIHGAMNYIPSITASFIYGDDRVIVGTRIINTIIVCTCWILFLDLCYFFTSKLKNRTPWILMAMLILFFITPKLNSTALSIQQAFLGVRDLFMITTVWCVAHYTASTTLIRSRFFLTLGCISAVVAIFWSYDRGIISFIFLGVIFLGINFQKKFLDSALMLMAIAASLLILDTANLFGSLLDNIKNIMYWVKNSKEVFGTSVFIDPISLTITSIVLIFCVATFIISISEKFYNDKKNLIIILGVFAIQIILLKTIMNRPGMPRLSWAIWPSILMTFYLSSRIFEKRYKISTRVLIKSVARMNFSHKAYLIILASLVLIMSPWFFWYGSFAKNLLNPRLDLEIVSAEIRHLGKAISKHDDECFFGWSNEGVTALLIKKRFCTKFPYLVYASKNEDINILNALILDAPKSIVFEITGESMMNIDNRDMKSRLPSVSKFITDNYKNQTHVGRYLIVSK